MLVFGSKSPTIRREKVTNVSTNQIGATGYHYIYIYVCKYVRAGFSERGSRGIKNKEAAASFTIVIQPCPTKKNIVRIIETALFPLNKLTFDNKKVTDEHPLFTIHNNV